MKKQIIINKKPDKKKDTENINNDMLKELNNVSTVNKMFLNEEFENKNIIKSNVMKKRSSYRTQDVNKDRLKDDFITYDEIIEKLVISKLKCSYCKENVLILYENKRDYKQWTLDRIDNSCGHNNDNIVIACLECNLKRRRMNMDRFKFSKECVNIKKTG